MAILKKSKIGSKLMTIIVVVAVLAVGVPLVSAYETHSVNVKAHVKERFNLIKTIRLATTEEIELSGITFPSPPHGSDNLSDAYSVPINTCVVWIVELNFANSENYSMTQVVVRDHFGAELAGEPIDDVPVDLQFKSHTRGKSKKQKHTEDFITQYRITWYVTYTGTVPLPEDPAEDNWGVMAPGDNETMQMYVWTKKNPAGHQEYTSPGDYTLNSGPTGKWLVFPDGPQYSFGGEELAVHIEAD